MRFSWKGFGDQKLFIIIPQNSESLGVFPLERTNTPCTIKKAASSSLKHKAKS